MKENLWATALCMDSLSPLGGVWRLSETQPRTRVHVACGRQKMARIRTVNVTAACEHLRLLSVDWNLQEQFADAQLGLCPIGLIIQSQGYAPPHMSAQGTDPTPMQGRKGVCEA